jgi:hypothetical protein
MRDWPFAYRKYFMDYVDEEDAARDAGRSLSRESGDTRTDRG